MTKLQLTKWDEELPKDEYPDLANQAKQAGIKETPSNLTILELDKWVDSNK